MKIAGCTEAAGHTSRAGSVFKKKAVIKGGIRLFGDLLLKSDRPKLARAMAELRQGARPVVVAEGLVMASGTQQQYRWQLRLAQAGPFRVQPDASGGAGCKAAPFAHEGGAQASRLPAYLQDSLCSTLEHMSDALVMLDRNWYYTYANKKACDLLGISYHELVGKHIWRDIFPAKVGSQFYKDCLTALASQQQLVSENLYTPTNAHQHLLESRMYPSKEGLLIFFTDLTEKKALEQRAQTAQKQLQDLQTALNTSSIVSITDAQGRITWVNDNFCTISQYSKSELCGQPHPVFYTHQPPAATNDLLATLQRGEIWKGEIHLRTKEGAPLWMSTAITPFLDASGRLTHNVHICKDITLRKKAEQALRESEKLYRSLIENESGAVFITDVQGNITVANRHAALLTGVAVTNLLGTNLLKLLPAAARNQLSTGLPLILQGNNLHFETKISGLGTPFSASVTVGVIAEEGSISQFFFKLKDISKRVNYEKDLALLNNTSRALGAAYSLKEGAIAVIQLLCQYTGFQYGEFWMPMFGQTHTRMKAYWEAGNDYWPVTHASLDRTWDMVNEKKHLFGTGKPYFVPDIRLDPAIRRKDLALSCGLQAFFSIPIIYRNKILGVVGLWATDTQENPSFDPAHLQSLMEKLGAEIERRQNNEAFKKFFTLTPDLFCIIGFDGLPKRANPALQALLGYSAEEYELFPVSELIHPDDAERGRVSLEKIYRGESCHNLELRIRCKDGSYRWLSFTTQSSLADSLIYLVGRDITQQKQQREEIERIKIAIENTSDAIGIATSPEEVVYTNTAFMSSLGWDVPRMNAIGGPRGIFVDQEVPNRIIGSLYTLGHWEGDIDIYDAWGATRLFYLRCNAVLDEQRQFKYLVGIFIDVAQKRLEQEELLKLNQAVEDSGNEVYIINTSTRKFSYINKKGLENLGYTRSELASLSPLDVNPDYDRLRYKKLFHPLLIGQEKSLTYQTTHQRRDGSQYPVEVYLTLFRHGAETSIMAHAIDITERKLAEEELSIINERYRLVTKATQDAIWDWDMVKKKGYFGEGYATLFGQDPSQGSLGYWSEHLHPQDKARVLANLEQVVNSKRTEWTIEYRYRCSDGTYKFVKDRGYVIRDAEGNAIRTTGALSDISEHKNSEELLRQFNAELEAKVTQKTARLATTLTKMQQEMLARQQVEANLQQSLQEKEVLLKEIHHRVKNNMAIISGLLSLQARHSQQPEVRILFQESQQRIKSMALTHELLYQHKNLSRINFQKYIQELTEGISYAFRGSQTNVQLQIEADAADLDIVLAIPCGLILNEIITNAYKYAFIGKQDGTIKVKFKQKEKQYSLEVSDSGYGLPAQFENSQSKSLGMQLVNNLVRQLGGTLSYHSAGGAHFLITFADNSTT